MSDNTIRVHCLEGPLEGREFRFAERRIVLGRSDGCAVRLDDALCSREHAAIERTSDGFVLVDLDSTNGLEINGQRAKRSAIVYGDRFRVGKSLFVFLGAPALKPSGDTAPVLKASDVDSDPDETSPIIEGIQSCDEIERRLEAWSRGDTAPAATGNDSAKDSRQLHALCRLSRVINATLEPDALYQRISESLFNDIAEIQRICFFITRPESGEIERVKSLSRSGSEDTRVSKAVLSRALNEKIGILAQDAQTDGRFDASTTVFSMQVRSLMCVPLVERDQVLGAIYVENCERSNCFSQLDLELLTILANQAAVAIRNALLYDELQHSFYEAIKSLGNALEAKDRYTRGHSARVARYAVGIAEELGLDPARTETLRIASELHDIGKIAITESIINKSRPLTDDEFESIMAHPALGVSILEPIRFLKDALPIILHHHERYDGTGYPDGLAGEAIPLEARVLNLADAFDAMTTQRSYNKPRTVESALACVRAEAGVSFDAACVAALERYVARCEPLHDTAELALEAQAT